jgi:hypothetical protein
MTLLEMGDVDCEEFFSEKRAKAEVKLKNNAILMHKTITAKLVDAMETISTPYLFVIQNVDPSLSLDQIRGWFNINILKEATEH